MKNRNLISAWLTTLYHSPKTAGKLCLATAAAGVLLTGCGGSGDGSTSATPPPTGENEIPTVSFNLELPDSMTGGLGSLPANKTGSLKFAKSAAYFVGENLKPGDLPCAYIGSEDDNPFENGYEVTKFMVSAVALWGCVADLLIDVANFVPHDGSIVESDNDLNAEDYEPDDPTHYSVTDDSEVQTTVRLYYGYNRSVPPTGEDLAGFYLSWTEDANGTLRGKMTIDTLGLDEQYSSDDPVQMRLDFVQDDAEKVHDMFLRFAEDNPWADGLRIRVRKDLAVNPLEQVFTAQGLMGMTAQFIPVDGIDELPDIRVFSVANAIGEGASHAQINDVGLPIPLNFERSLGGYLVAKEDIYFFDDDQQSAEQWDWISKRFTSAEYRGGRNALDTDGTWIPFNPSLDMVETALELDQGYFTGVCAEVGDECVDFMNAVFVDGFAEQEPNQGDDPNDWRTLALQAATYLDTVYPNGVDWTDAFAQEFQP